jgi:hypothetical protein
MLYQLIERICTDIDKLPAVGVGEPALAQQIAQAAPEAVEQIIAYNKTQGKKLTKDAAAKTLALLGFTLIRGIPRTARAMVAKVQDRSVPAARRAAVASVLAYLVQPHDVIPDDAPGYYGYLDDAILLNAGLVAYLDTLPAGTDASGTIKLVEFAIGLTPPQARPMLQLGVSTMSQLVQMLAMVGDEIAEFTLMQIVANPLQASSAVSPPSGFRPGPVRDYGGGHWSGGNYFEGNNVIMGGGGPSLIDGQLFIPG